MLQKVFDDIWLKLERQNSPLTFPWAIEASRFTLARLVLEHWRKAKDADKIRREVLERMECPE
jgi:hypothetical protein